MTRRARWWLLLLALSPGACRRASVAQRPAPHVAASTEQVVPAGLVTAQAAPAASAAVVVAPSTSLDPASQCVEQAAQEFLIQAHLSNHALTSARAQSEWWSILQRSIRYRTEQYGYYEGFGSRAWNPRPLSSQLRATQFVGIPVVMHERVIPALRCVEQALARDCQDHPYQPRTLAGLRLKNTYFGGEVTNHVYGIALDIEPSENPCCNCVEPWRSSPRCRGNKTELERMAMPACWITTFERYGFYWLGHDELKDTMHFEFLGDPAKIGSTSGERRSKSAERFEQSK